MNRGEGSWGNQKFPLNILEEISNESKNRVCLPMFATDVPLSTVTYWDVTTFQEVDEIRGGCLYAEAWPSFETLF